MQNKRGISGIILTVIIIAVAIAALVIVWGFIRPALISSGETAEVQAELISTGFDISPESVVIDDVQKTLEVNIVRRAGGAESLSAVRIVLEDIDGYTQAFYIIGDIEEFESKKIKINYPDTGLKEIVKIGVFAVAKTTSGEEVTGSIGDSIVKSENGQFSYNGKVKQGSGGGSSGGGSGSESGGNEGPEGTESGNESGNESNVEPTPEPPLENVNLVCVDSDDDSGTVEEQSKVEGFASVWYNDCENDEDSGVEDCDALASSYDVCKNSNTLYEQTCSNDALIAREVSCSNGCSQGRCL